SQRFDKNITEFMFVDDVLRENKSSPIFMDDNFIVVNMSYFAYRIIISREEEYSLKYVARFLHKIWNCLPYSIFAGSSLNLCFLGNEQIEILDVFEGHFYLHTQYTLPS
ncbi:hypothetical protein ACJX0J_037124, partial [Zea mays]